MLPACNQWIVIEVEDPTGVVCIIVKEHGWVHHCSSSDVVAERLDFQPTVVEQPADICTNAYIVRIDIETAFDKNVAQPEVVRLHGRVVATFKGVLVARTQRATDKRLGTPLVEQLMREAIRGPACPGGDALFYVSGQLSQVMPELNDSSGRTLHVLRLDRQPTGRSLDQPSDEFRTLSMVFLSVGHLFSSHSIRAQFTTGIPLISALKLSNPDHLIPLYSQMPYDIANGAPPARKRVVLED